MAFVHAAGGGGLFLFAEVEAGDADDTVRREPGLDALVDQGDGGAALLGPEVEDRVRQSGGRRVTQVVSP